MTDPIADMLTRIRNALQVRRESVSIPYSKMKEAILRVIAAEGYVKGYEMIGEGIRKQLVVELKYVRQSEPVISGMKRISKPGLRVYHGAEGLESFSKGLGAAIISTSKGIMTHREASKAKMGGEVLCRIW